MENKDQIDFSSLDQIIIDAKSNSNASAFYNKIKNLIDENIIYNSIMKAIADKNVTALEIFDIMKYVCSVIRSSKELVDAFTKEIANDSMRILIFTSIKEGLAKHSLDENIQDVIEFSGVIDVAIKAVDMGVNFLMENVVYEGAEQIKKCLPKFKTFLKKKLCCS